MGDGKTVRVATVAYLLLMAWFILGRPDLRLRVMGAARKTLRKVATVADSAAARLGDEMIDRATGNVTS